MRKGSSPKAGGSDESCGLTPLGLLMAKLGMKEGRRAFDILELASRRAVRTGGIAAVVFEKVGGRFAEVERLRRVHPQLEPSLRSAR